MTKKLILLLVLICIAIFSLSSVNAIWPFDGGSDIMVNDVKFHIPDGFEEITSGHEITKSKEKVTIKMIKKKS